jgi:DNA-binding ferritin-like protein
VEKIWKLANLYVATLRSIYFIEQHCHWASKGNDFYGNHLLFERLYKTAQENADLAAEKFIGILGPEALNYAMQTDFMNRLLNKYENYCDDLLELALTIEKDFLAF